MTFGSHDIDARVDHVEVGAFRIPTELPESDGTLEWHATTLVTVEIAAGGKIGLGYTYAHEATAHLIREMFAPILRDSPIALGPQLHARCLAAVRNLGREGIAATARSAVDTALWDLRAKIFDAPLCDMLGMVRDAVPIYGSGGFTSYDVPTLERQLNGWVDDGLKMVKMKIGRDAASDPMRIAAARKAIGESPQLFVDANGGYAVKEALLMAQRMEAWNVAWFEEPVYHGDLEGLRFIRNSAPVSMEISAGEYGFDSRWFKSLLLNQAVDVVQADATRCGGISGFLAADALCDAWEMPLSSHCAPAIHLHAACAAKRLRHMEYFHDHVRIESMLFDGVVTPRNGMLCPERTRPGHGLELKRKDAQRFAC